MPPLKFPGALRTTISERLSGENKYLVTVRRLAPQYRPVGAIALQACVIPNSNISLPAQILWRI